MRGGLERWKRGAESHGVRQAMAYAFEGTCDSHVSAGAASASGYADVSERTVTRFLVDDGRFSTDELSPDALAAWIDGRDPITGAARGRVLTSPDADLLLDGTINAPKSFSIAALLHPDLATEFEALQDRLRDRVIKAWASELNARRGAGGRIREELSRIEVVELKHRRSRALDPHVHRHLWLSVKVRGKDGQWSNVDSRVAMRFHTVVNAEGELAARTDPRWRAALAAHGYNVAATGEIAELAHLVKPLSRRSNQIEANRAELLAQWSEDHAGREPTADVIRGIDRRAWATGRPNKPHQVDEDDWERLICDEIAELDAAVRARRAPTDHTGGALVQVDVALLASRAVADADARSTGYGGRFSTFDLRAGAMRAVAASGMIADRDVLQHTVDQVIERAMTDVEDLLDGEDRRPAHLKALMASVTWRLKQEIEEALDRLAEHGRRPSAESVRAVAARVLDGAVVLDDGQLAATAAISGTDRLVSVTGPAGSGKTAMLKAARAALEAQGRRVIVVAPTKKAATVAAREVGADATSLHALLFDHGWRWAVGASGGQEWVRLRPGETDPLTGALFNGPRRHLLREGDRIVVDEAGMVDLQASSALFAFAVETGVGIAMVGDHLQAAPVGHAGAMAALTRRATAVVQLRTVHRFNDPEYANLTLRLREPAGAEDAKAVAGELVARGHVVRVDGQEAARAVMVGRYFDLSERGRRVALVTGSNDEADALNEAIQQQRIARGEIDAARIAFGADEQRVMVGDVVQTRRNHTAMGVENRATWVVTDIDRDIIRLASTSDQTVRRTVSADYAASYVRLAYAATVHGSQGETTDASIVGPDVDASGLYVGMTRGRHQNEAIVIAPNASAAVTRLAETMRRGLPEVTVEESRIAAAQDQRRAAHDPAPAASTQPATDWRTRAGRSTLRLAAMSATKVARQHGAVAVDGADDLDRQLAALRQAIAHHDEQTAERTTRESVHSQTDRTDHLLAPTPGRGIG
ncbi:AAA family ATPase [Microbacterium testaceum]|uniref:AAA family ATPase n=1 Tax=Microbacterium testaceum TaxID=2033 RepID=UPI001D1701D0|nr:AAA family ATPase [Microbacterium testaceum]MCC4248237.1 AAA family ATPase [Microbacterium testaceum]